jgi:hypothetical protein
MTLIANLPLSRFHYVYNLRPYSMAMYHAIVLHLAYTVLSNISNAEVFNTFVPSWLSTTISIPPWWYFYFTSSSLLLHSSVSGSIWERPSLVIKTSLILMPVDLSTWRVRVGVFHNFSLCIKSSAICQPLTMFTVQYQFWYKWECLYLVCFVLFFSWSLS